MPKAMTPDTQPAHAAPLKQCETIAEGANPPLTLPPRTTRRAIDAPLLAACAHHIQLEAAYRAANGDEDVVCPPGYDAALLAVADLPAHTPEGLRAKADAILAFHGGRVRDDASLFMSPHEAMEWSLVLDVAGRAEAEELDSELIAACAAFQQAEAVVKASDDCPRPLSDAEWKTMVDAPGLAWMHALEAVRACPSPRTPEGLQAKAKAAHTALLRLTATDETRETALALDCLADVSGRRAA